MPLSIFGFRALWSPYFFVSLAVVLVLFFLITIKFRHRFKTSEPLTFKEGAFFTSAIVVLYIIKGSPIDLMGHLMFYAHMIQMAVLYLVVPILFIHGIPTWIWRGVINHPKVQPLFKFFTKPLIALIFFNGLFSFYHIPLIFDFVKTDMTLHTIYTAVLFVFSLFMWWPLVNKLPEHQTLSGLKKIGYIFADGILLTPACALIIFADVPMYATYSDPHAWGQALALCVPSATLANLNLSGPEMFNSMSLLHDQQLGGVIMKVIQEIVYGYILALVFFSWYRNEQSDSKAVENNLMNPRPAE